MICVFRNAKQSFFSNKVDSNCCCFAGFVFICLVENPSSHCCRREGNRSTNDNISDQERKQCLNLISKPLLWCLFPLSDAISC